MSTAPSMLHGDVRPVILRLALPSMAAMSLTGLCALPDALLLGRQGTDTASAVAAALPVLTLIQTIGFTLGMGAGSFVSRSLGGGERKAALTAASTAFFLALFLSLLLCAAGFVFAGPLCVLLGAGEQALAPAAAYVRFVLAGGPMLCMSLVLSSILRALGEAASNLAAFGLGAALGAPLQALLIPRMGVTGSGIAMLAREALTFALLFALVRRRAFRFRPRIGLVSLSPGCLADIMRSGTPTLVRQGLMSLSAALLTRTSAAFGAHALAGMGLCARATALVSSAVIGFGQGFAPVCGFAFGAKDMQRVQKAYRFCLRCMVVALLLLGAAGFAFAPALLAPFSPEPAAADFAVRALRAQCAVFFAQGAVVLMNMLTQAMGMTVRASVIAASRQGYVLAALLLTLPRLFGETGLILCQSASDLISLALSAYLVRGCLQGAPLTRSSCAPCGRLRARTASQ